MTAATPKPYKTPNREATHFRVHSLIKTSVWKAAPFLNVEGWLANFDEDDLDYAYALLNSFLFIPNTWADQLFISGLQDLSKSICSPNAPLVAQQRTWRQFLSSAVVTYITGEDPNPTDSGYAFARKARQLAGFEEINICHPNEAFRRAKHDLSPVIFVDDFVGSGSQTIRTWFRQYDTTSPSTFAELSSTPGVHQFFYAPLMMTDQGKIAVEQNCPRLNLQPVHVLNNSYSAVHPDSRIWPAGMQRDGVDFIRRVSADLGIPDTNGSDVDDWQGFAKLGLCFAFEHSVPDATLPILRWEENGWTPLIRRV